MGSMANKWQLHTRPTNVQNKLRNPSFSLSDGLYRLDHPDSNIFLPRPVWSASICGMDNDSEHLRKVDDKRNKSCFACKPSQSCDATSSCSCSSGSSCDEQSCGESCNESCNCSCSNNSDNANSSSTISNGKETCISPWPCVVVGAETSSKTESQSVSDLNNQSGVAT